MKGRRRIDNCSNFWWRTERRRGRVEGGGEEGKKYGERVTEKRGGKKRDRRGNGKKGGSRRSWGGVRGRGEEGKEGNEEGKQRSRGAPLPAALPPRRAVTSWQLARQLQTLPSLGPSSPAWDQAPCPPRLPSPPRCRGGRPGPGAARPLPTPAPTLRTGCGQQQPHRPPGLRPPPPLRPSRPAAGRRGSRGSGFLPSPRAAGIRLLRGGGSGCIPGTLSPRRRPRRLLLPAGLSPLSGPRLPSAAGRRSPVPPLRSLLSALGSVMAAAELPRLSLG